MCQTPTNSTGPTLAKRVNATSDGSNDNLATTTSAIETLKDLDSRHPLFTGDWERSIPGIHKGIATDNLDEPHIKRKLTILKSHPEIKELYATDSRTKHICMVAVLAQLASAYLFGRVIFQDSWIPLVVGSYFIGGTLTQLFGVIIHEAAHNLCGPSMAVNRYTGFLANIGIVFPIFASFRRYHLEHHAYQGVKGYDPDLPLDWEMTFVKGNSFLKLCFLFFYPVMYVVRGLAMQKTPTRWEIYNVVWTVATDTVIWQTCGARGFLYMFLSLWFGYGVHPAAAHFIQEHFTFDDGQETYSYYGILNWFFMNIGYHNEHHDFSKVPWSNLPKIREIAPEFYNKLAYHTSWVMVLVNFVLDRKMGPQSRVGRDISDHRKGRHMVNGLRI